MATPGWKPDDPLELFVQAAVKAARGSSLRSQPDETLWRVAREVVGAYADRLLRRGVKPEVLAQFEIVASEVAEIVGPRLRPQVHLTSQLVRSVIDERDHWPPFC